MRASKSKPPSFFEIRTRPLFKWLLFTIFALPIGYLIWAFSDSGTEYFPGGHSQGGSGAVVGDGLTEVSIPIGIGSNMFWRGKDKTLYVNILSPDEWGNIAESDKVEHCRITLTNHSSRPCIIGASSRSVLAPGQSVNILDGELNHPSFHIYDLKMKKLELELKCSFSKPLAPNTTVNVVATWSAVKY